jgi:hypothetical protein
MLCIAQGAAAERLYSALMAGHFLLRRQKKVTKEKATPGFAVGCADFPALLAEPGTPGVLPRDAVHRSGRGCATRPCGAQTVLADFPRLVCVARRGTRGTPKTVSARPLTGAIAPKDRLRSCPLRRRAAQGAPQEYFFATLRAQREKGRGLSEPRRGEFRSPPLRPSSAEHPAQPGDAAGAPFLWLLSFWQDKRKQPAIKAGPGASEADRQPRHQGGTQRLSSRPHRWRVARAVQRRHSSVVGAMG